MTFNRYFDQNTGQYRVDARWVPRKLSSDEQEELNFKSNREAFIRLHRYFHKGGETK